MHRGVHRRCFPGLLVPIIRDFGHHRTDIHLAVAAIGGRREVLPLAVAVGYVNHLALEAALDELPGIVGIDAVEFAVEQGQAHVPAVVEDPHLGGLGVQCLGGAAAAAVDEGHSVQPVCCLVDAADQQAVAAQIADEYPFLLLENEGGLAPLEIGLDAAGLVVPVGENAVVEQNHQSGQNRGGREDRLHHLKQTDAARFHGEDFAVGGESAERHQHRHEHRHRHGEGDNPAEVVEEQLTRSGKRQSPAQHPVHHLQHHVDDQHEHDQRTGEQKRAQML